MNKSIVIVGAGAVGGFAARIWRARAKTWTFVDRGGACRGTMRAHGPAASPTPRVLSPSPCRCKHCT